MVSFIDTDKLNEICDSCIDVIACEDIGFEFSSHGFDAESSLEFAYYILQDILNLSERQIMDKVSIQIKNLKSR